MSKVILAIDQGTTGTTVLAVSPDGDIVGRGSRDHPQSFPEPGRVEHDAEAIWTSVMESAAAALTDAGRSPADVAAVGITNQRETVVAWDSITGRPLGPTIVWQDRRTAARCAELEADGVGDTIRAVTGLPIDPYFSATKFEWLLAHDPDVRAAAASGSLRLGTVDSWLIHRMTGGAAHITDASNAARTMLYDIHAGAWSMELCERFGIDQRWLPTVVDSIGVVAETRAGCCGEISAPISGIAGDQQSALFGQACLEPGQAKATYGTGAFVLANSGAQAPVSVELISTVAWQRGGVPTYALEGSVFTAGASVQWLRDGLGIIEQAADSAALAASVPDTGGVVVVPAFAGLGAPIWDPNARAAILGATRGTTSAHIARATLEAVAFRVRQLVDAMGREGTQVTSLRVDGGMATNDFFLQLQADVLGVPVTRPVHIESTSLGVAMLAAVGCGIHATPEEAAAAWRADRTFTPTAGAPYEAAYERFQAGVAAVRAFANAAAR